MKQLSGFVLAKEINTGVPNLIVAAYDAIDVVRSAVDPRLPRNALQQLGRRLGSVLTDQHGGFVLTRRDLEFQGNEARPNLLIAVFAPEDSQSVENPFPLPPEERLLFVSSVARVNAGAREASVIRVLQAQLDRFGIPIGGAATPGATAVTRQGDAIERAWDTPIALRDRFRERIKVQVDAVAERRGLAKAATKNLSGIPPHLRDRDGAPNPLQNNALLIADRRDLAAQLMPLQLRAAREGLTRLSQRKTPPVLRLYLTRAELNTMGVEVNADGVAKGDVDSAALRDAVRGAMRGTDLIKERGLNNPSPEDLRRRYLLAPEGSNNGQVSVATATRDGVLPPVPARSQTKRTRKSGVK